MDSHEDTEKVGELVRLSQIEYEQEPDAPNILGWPVVDQNDEEFGTLDDMLVDVETGEVPFASVCYSGKCTAVPLDVMYLDEPNHRLVLPVGKDEIHNAPEFTDDTEDIQPYVEYWDNLTADWEEEEEFEDGD